MTTSSLRLIVGTYRRLGGAGLVALAASEDGLVVGNRLAPLADASFGMQAGQGRMLFAVEQTEGRVVMLSPRDWTELAWEPSGGSAPCHLALDPAGMLLAIANYESGSVSLVRLGTAFEATATVRFSGRGADPERQAGPHAHWVGFHRDRLYCVDLGSDRIWCFRVDHAEPRLGSPAVAYGAPAGSGPRHLAFHPTRPRAYLISELASTLTVLAVAEDGQLDPLETISTLPPGVEDSLGGAILLDAAHDRLYVTNRGHDSIATFALEGDRAIPVGHTPSGGASPRFLLLLADRRRMLVANEEGGTVAQFRISADGRLNMVGEPARIPGAVFLAIAPDQARTATEL